jgi:Glycosyl hydrolase family 26
VLAAGLVLASAASAGVLASGAGARPAPSGVALSGAGLTAPAVPVHGAYFGADPGSATGDVTRNGVAPQTTVGSLAALQSQLGHPVTIVSFYIQWDEPPPLTGMSQVAAQGSIPLVSWHCGVADSEVAAGSYDGLIRQEAEAYKAYARPVFVRWFWEMNLPTAGNHPTCLGTTDETQEYIAAYQRIWEIFKQVGADNVAFIWAPSAAVSAGASTGFYPGNQYVDWIGFDVYDRCGKGTFSAVFAPTYATYATSAYAKPMMITETGASAPEELGACSEAGEETQAEWIQDIETSIPTKFPDVHGFVWVNATDSLGNYELFGQGLAVFASLGRSAYYAQVVGDA